MRAGLSSTGEGDLQGEVGGAGYLGVMGVKQAVVGDLVGQGLMFTDRPVCGAQPILQFIVW